MNNIAYRAKYLILLPVYGVKYPIISPVYGVKYLKLIIFAYLNPFTERFFQEYATPECINNKS